MDKMITRKIRPNSQLAFVYACQHGQDGYRLLYFDRLSTGDYVTRLFRCRDKGDISPREMDTFDSCKASEVNDRFKQQHQSLSLDGYKLVKKVTRELDTNDRYALQVSKMSTVAFSQISHTLENARNWYCQTLFGGLRVAIVIDIYGGINAYDIAQSTEERPVPVKISPSISGYISKFYVENKKGRTVVEAYIDTRLDKVTITDASLVDGVDVSHLKLTNRLEALAIDSSITHSEFECSISQPQLASRSVLGRVSDSNCHAPLYLLKNNDIPCALSGNQFTHYLVSETQSKSLVVDTRKNDSHALFFDHDCETSEKGFVPFNDDYCHLRVYQALGLHQVPGRSALLF